MNRSKSSFNFNQSIKSQTTENSNNVPASTDVGRTPKSSQELENLVAELGDLKLMISECPGVPNFSPYFVHHKSPKKIFQHDQHELFIGGMLPQIKSMPKEFRQKLREIYTNYIKTMLEKRTGVQETNLEQLIENYKPPVPMHYLDEEEIYYYGLTPVLRKLTSEELLKTRVYTLRNFYKMLSFLAEENHPTSDESKTKFLDNFIIDPPIVNLDQKNDKTKNKDTEKSPSKQAGIKKESSHTDSDVFEESNDCDLEVLRITPSLWGLLPPRNVEIIDQNSAICTKVVELIKTTIGEGFMSISTSQGEEESSGKSIGLDPKTGHILFLDKNSTSSRNTKLIMKDPKNGLPKLVDLMTFKKDLSSSLEKEEERQEEEEEKKDVAMGVSFESLDLGPNKELESLSSYISVDEEKDQHQHQYQEEKDQSKKVSDGLKKRKNFNQHNSIDFPFSLNPHNKSLKNQNQNHNHNHKLHVTFNILNEQEEEEEEQHQQQINNDGVVKKMIIFGDGRWQRQREREFWCSTNFDSRMFSRSSKLRPAFFNQGSSLVMKKNVGRSRGVEDEERNRVLETRIGQDERRFYFGDRQMRSFGPDLLRRDVDDERKDQGFHLNLLGTSGKNDQRKFRRRFVEQNSSQFQVQVQEQDQNQDLNEDQSQDQDLDEDQSQDQDLDEDQSQSQDQTQDEFMENVRKTLDNYVNRENQDQRHKKMMRPMKFQAFNTFNVDGKVKKMAGKVDVVVKGPAKKRKDEITIKEDDGKDDNQNQRQDQERKQFKMKFVENEDPFLMMKKVKQSQEVEDTQNQVLETKKSLDEHLSNIDGGITDGKNEDLLMLKKVKHSQEVEDSQNHVLGTKRSLNERHSNIVERMTEGKNGDPLLLKNVKRSQEVEDPQNHVLETKRSLNERHSNIDERMTEGKNEDPLLMLKNVKQSLEVEDPQNHVLGTKKSLNERHSNIDEEVKEVTNKDLVSMKMKNVKQSQEVEDTQNRVLETKKSLNERHSNIDERITKVKNEDLGSMKMKNVKQSLEVEDPQNQVLGTKRSLNERHSTIDEDFKDVKIKDPVLMMMKNVKQSQEVENPQNHVLETKKSLNERHSNIGEEVKEVKNEDPLLMKMMKSVKQNQEMEDTQNHVLETKKSLNERHLTIGEDFRDVKIKNPVLMMMKNVKQSQEMEDPQNHVLETKKSLNERHSNMGEEVKEVTNKDPLLMMMMKNVKQNQEVEDTQNHVLETKKSLNERHSNFGEGVKEVTNKDSVLMKMMKNVKQSQEVEDPQNHVLETKKSLNERHSIIDEDLKEVKNKDSMLRMMMKNIKQSQEMEDTQNHVLETKKKLNERHSNIGVKNEDPLLMMKNVKQSQEVEDPQNQLLETKKSLTESQSTINEGLKEVKTEDKNFQLLWKRQIQEQTRDEIKEMKNGKAVDVDVDFYVLKSIDHKSFRLDPLTGRIIPQEKENRHSFYFNKRRPFYSQEFQQFQSQFNYRQSKQQQSYKMLKGVENERFKKYRLRPEGLKKKPRQEQQQQQEQKQEKQEKKIKFSGKEVQSAHLNSNGLANNKNVIVRNKRSVSKFFSGLLGIGTTPNIPNRGSYNSNSNNTNTNKNFSGTKRYFKRWQ